MINKITGPIQPSDLEFLSSISPEKMADTIPKDEELVNVDLLMSLIRNYVTDIKMAA